MSKNYILGNSQQEEIVETASKLAELSISIKNTDDAVNFYKECLNVSPNNVNIMVSLAKLYMQVSISFGKLIIKCNMVIVDEFLGIMSTNLYQHLTN